ncbi:MAG TPA: carboxypeptidase regulatory-like domain-containing protein [Candidatus Dormibacteraeota bacterium]|nr:carboxypeptidase regulatory-like domain-containing protein [Candidatus Dormibacteraeota bacterium]
MRSVILLTAALAACVALAACGGYQFPGGGSSGGTGTVSGKVVAVPCAPVERVGSPCPGRPVQGLVLTLTSSSREQVTATTDAAGQYAVELKAGTWTVAFKSFMRIISGPTAVTVSAGGTVVANYVLDSGIRVPQPAA